MLVTIKHACLAAIALMACQLIHAAEPKPKDLLAEPFKSRPELEAGLQAAQEAGAAPETLLEAKILYALFHDREEAAQFEALYAETMQLQPQWLYSQCHLIEDARMLEAIQAALQAKIARLQDDGPAFEQHAQRALWLEPELSLVLNPWVKDYQQEQDWQTQHAPLDMVLLGLDGQEHTLGELLEGRKALLLDFWATWCGPCIRGMPKLEERARELEPQGVYVASVNTENTAKASAFRRDHPYEFHWLVQPKDRNFSRRFDIDFIPRVLIIAPDGQVLFNEHPNDPRLLKVLAELGVSLEGGDQ
ncbi:peroxiredoxin family protein [Cerasicoccus fimbriatus]|uniref:peroxiredoxin family protein n=1 Tax=Cerasicoccus fimbriatus TaxID=3014554 RepID=UPI0022B53A71|nr:TlpA disulfide reductase family protein [Cerasicoccus sp. TK19100]